MAARRPLIALGVAVVMIATVALIAGASPSRAPIQPTAVELSARVAQISFDGLPANLPVYEFSWSGRAAVSRGGGGGVGQPVLGPLIVTRQLDELSPNFLFLMLSGKITHTVRLEVFTPHQDVVALRYTLTNVHVTSFQHSAVGTADYTIPLDRMTLTYSKVCLQSFSPPGPIEGVHRLPRHHGLIAAFRS